MSRTVDERVVDMRLENNQFERAAQTSLATLGKLQNALNLGGATKGAEAVQDSFNSMDFSAALAGIEQLSNHFSGFGIIGDQILRRIGDAIANFGFKVTNIAKSLTFDQIGEGYGKFEELTRSTSTLMAQGKWELEEVEGQLERLNWFTDETSYSFLDMVNSINKFTASGQGLTESVNAMEGIATWAALSGQNAQTASRAMYQISQAMGAGVMRKEDYKSIQNAGMDTEEFRQKALDAGVALGTLRKNANGTYTSIVKGSKSATFEIGQFANNLTETMWFSDEVMMKTFESYASAIDQLYEYTQAHEGMTASDAIAEMGDQIDAFGLKAFKAAQEARSWGDVLDSIKDAVSTGWMNTWKIVFGNYKEATEFYTNLANQMYDIFMLGTETRLATLVDWKNLGGREDLMQGLYNILTLVLTALENVSEAFHDIFPPITGEQLANLTKKFRDFTELLTASSAAETIEEVSESIERIGKAAKGLTSGDLLEGTKLEEEVNKVATVWEKIQRTLKGVFAVVDILKQAFMALFDTIKPIFGLFPQISGGILDMTAGIGDWIVGVDEFIKADQTFAKWLGFLKSPIDLIKKGIQGLMSILGKLKDSFTSFSFSEIFGSKEEGITTKISKLFTKIEESSTNFCKSIEKTWPKVKKLLDPFIDIFKTLFARIGEAIKTGDIQSLATLLNTLFAGRLLKNLGDFSGGLADFAKTLKGVGEKGGPLDTVMDLVGGLLGFGKGKDGGLDTKPFVAIGEALLMIAGALFVISLIDLEKLPGVIITIELMESMLTRLAKALAQFAPSKMKDIAGLAVASGSLIAIAGSLILMSVALKVIATIDSDKLAGALIGIGALLAELWAFNKYSGKTQFKGMSFVGLAISLILICNQVKKLGEMDPDQMSLGLVGVGVILAELWAFNKFSGKTRFKGLAFIELAAALIIICNQVKKLGEMDTTQMMYGLAGVGAILLELAIFSQISGKMGVFKGLGFLAIAASLILICNQVEKLGKMNPHKLERGLAGVGAVLLELVLFAGLMNVASGSSLNMIALAASLLVMAGAIGLLVPSLILLGSVPLENIAVALGTLAGTFLILAIGAGLLTPLIIPMIGLAAAMALTGVAAIALAAGLTSLAGSFVVMTGAGNAMISFIGQAIQQLILLIPELIAALAIGVLEAVAQLCTKVLEMAAVYGPQIIAQLMLLLTNLLNVVAQYVPDLVQAAINLAISFIDGFGRGIVENTDKILSAMDTLGRGIVIFLLTALQDLVAKIPLVGDDISKSIQGMKESIEAEMNEPPELDTAVKMGESVSKGIEEAEPQVADAADKLAKRGEDELESHVDEYGEKGGAAGDKVAEGMEDSDTKVEGAINHLVVTGTSEIERGYAAFEGVTERIPERIAESLRNNSAPAINAVKEMAAEMAAQYGSTLGINSPSRVFAEASKHIPEGAAFGIRSTAYMVNDAITDLTSSMEGQFTSATETMGKGLSADYSTSPSIRPVIDFTDVSNGSSKISSMFDHERVSLAADSMELNRQGNQMDQLLNVANKMYRELQNGSDLYLDDNILAGRINRRLGMV